VTLLAVTLTAILLALALLHIPWANGFWCRNRDGALLVAAVVVLTGAALMPGPIPCARVAVGPVAAAMSPTPGARGQTGLAVAAPVFVIRSLVPLRPGWWRLTPLEPFATPDRRVYGPVSPGLNAGCAALFIERLT